MRITDSLILEVQHFSRPRTSALMAPVRAASSGLFSATGRGEIESVSRRRVV